MERKSVSLSRYMVQSVKSGKFRSEGSESVFLLERLEFQKLIQFAYIHQSVTYNQVI